MPPGAISDICGESSSLLTIVRADVIRQFCERRGGRELAEVLMDLEADELLRFKVVEFLRTLESEG